jgi:hypothetical protein
VLRKACPRIFGVDVGDKSPVLVTELATTVFHTFFLLMTLTATISPFAGPALALA